MSPDAKWHLWEIIIGFPMWSMFLYFIFVLVFYPNHRHGFNRKGEPTIEYPRGLGAGENRAAFGRLGFRRRQGTREFAVRSTTATDL